MVGLTLIIAFAQQLDYQNYVIRKFNSKGETGYKTTNYNKDLQCFEMRYLKCPYQTNTRNWANRGWDPYSVYTFSLHPVRLPDISACNEYQSANN